MANQKKQAIMSLSFLLATLAAATPPSPPPPTPTTNLTLHNLCSHPIWPLITPNAGLPDIVPTTTTTSIRLDGNGDGLVTVAFPAGAWSGRVVARTGCRATNTTSSFRCDTGESPPVTVAQVSVHGPGGLAEYSVSLVDGFNVPVVITPHVFDQGRQCPALGCAADLAADCPIDARSPGGGCDAQAEAFKARCPDTRTTPTDVEVTPQRCLLPGELKVVFCPTTDNQLHRAFDPSIMASMAQIIVILAAVALAVSVPGAASAAWTNTFTMHNLCPYPIWPLVTPNSGVPSIVAAAGDIIRLDSNGLATLAFPPSVAWSGRVVPRTGCDAAATRCATGDAPPFTVAQVSVNNAGGGMMLAEYSVSLVDGFNVPATITPHAFDAGEMCPVLGCAVDLDAACPGSGGSGGGGCRASPEFFKEMCPEARTTATDVEATPQRCFGPGEIKLVFCPTI
uniref:Thaumatin-like protein n=1 Tax=Leersia perrieri TaxID=77586 RepID=A0A0D9XVN8_9ORYZ